jgi:hypothetical protein
MPKPSLRLLALPLKSNNRGENFPEANLLPGNLFSPFVFLVALWYISITEGL